MMLCAVLGFLPAFRAAMRARPDLPHAAFMRAAHHTHPRYASRGCRVTADDVWMLAEHFYCHHAALAGVRCA